MFYTESSTFHTSPLNCIVFVCCWHMLFHKKEKSIIDASIFDIFCLLWVALTVSCRSYSLTISFAVILFSEGQYFLFRTCTLSRKKINTCLIDLLIFFLFFPVALRPNAGRSLLILEVSRSHTTTHHSRYDSSGRVISASQRLLPDNTQHSQQTSIPPVGFEPTIWAGEWP